MTILNGLRTQLGIATLALAATFGMEGCGARTGLREEDSAFLDTPKAVPQSNDTCIINQGPRCAARGTALRHLDLSAGDPIRARRVLLSRHPQLATMPLTNGFMMHHMGDYTSTSRPQIENVTSFVEHGGLLILGGDFEGSAFVLFYYINSVGSLNYSDFGDGIFVNSLMDWRNRFAPGSDVHPDIAMIRYFGMRSESPGGSVDLNAASPGNNCTILRDVAAMAVMGGTLYVVSSDHAVAAYPGFSLSAGVTNIPGVYATGDGTDLCR